MWQSVVTLVAVVVGAALAYVGQRALSRSSERHRWDERAAETLADTQMFLTDLHPDRIALNLDPVRTPLYVEELGKQSRLIRREVSVLAAGHPDSRVRSKARDLEPLIGRTWSSVSWLVTDMVRNRDFKEERDRATELWSLSDQLVKAITERLHA
jgi:hypothetical protein